MQALRGSPEWRFLWIVVLVLSFALQAAAQQFRYEKLRQFSNSDTVLAGPLVLGDDGYFYGTLSGGSHRGNLYRLSAGGGYENLYRFHESVGSYPAGPLVPAEDGSFYGVTRYGGSAGYDCGVVFRFGPDKKLTVLHQFTPKEGRGVTKLLAGPDGAFYGFTSYGGPKNGGSVFRITPEGEFSLLHTFSQEIIGGTKRAPNSPTALILGSDGHFYGTTTQGGPIDFNGNSQYSYGVIFRLTTDGEFSVLHEFTKNGPEYPNSLVEGPNGAFYGTSGATMDSSGHVFRLNQRGKFEILHTFQPTTSSPPVSPDGYYPFGLMLGRDGYLYGATAYGGVTFYGGTIFRINTEGVLQTIHAFSDRVSGGPTAGLVQDENGSLYGFTSDSGPNGSLYRLVYTGTPLNRPPTAQSLTHTHPAGQSALSIHLLFEANDPDGDLLTASIATQPQHGQASVEGSYLVYRPNDPNAVQDDSFTFTVSDGRGGTATAMVSIVLGPNSNNRAPVAPDLYLFLQPDGATPLSVLQGAIDPDGDTLTVTAVSTAKYGLAEVNSEGLGTYSATLEVLEDSFTVTISDGHGHTIDRLVTLRRPVAGSFEGLLRADTPGAQPVGQIRMHVRESQVFSASLRIHGSRYAFTGNLDFHGRYQTTIHGPTGSFELTLQALAGGVKPSVRVTLESPDTNYFGNAESRKFASAGGLAGRYTMLLPAQTGMQGTGYATLLVDSDGVTRLVGRAPDGTPISAGTELREDNEFELFASLGSEKKPKGSISGTISFQVRPGVSDGHGSLTWFQERRGRKRERTLTQRALLSRYRPNALPSLANNKAVGSAQVRLRGGGLARPASIDVMLSRSGFYSFTSELSVQGTLSPATGLFRGMFTHPASRTQGSFSGVIFQAQQRGAGVVVSHAGRGKIELRVR